MRRNGTKRLHAVAGVLLAMAPATGQEAKRWLQDIESSHASIRESAERKLVAMGPKAVPFLEDALEEWDDSKGMGRERCLALLRVIQLIGADAAALAGRLQAIGEAAPGLDCEICHTLACLLPFADNKNGHRLIPNLHGGDPERAKYGVVGFVRMYARAQARDFHDGEAMMALLKKDLIGSREAAAEAAGTDATSGDRRTAAPTLAAAQPRQGRRPADPQRLSGAVRRRVHVPRKRGDDPARPR